MIGLLLAALGLGLAGLDPSGAFFLLDAGWFFATGEFLVPVGSLGATPEPIHPTS